MASRFLATASTELPQLEEFLRANFAASVSTNSFQPDVLRWKYFAPRADWVGPRSYLVRRDAHLAAHGGVWPVTLRAPAGTLRAIHLIDWAADRSSPGSGVLLVKKLAATADLLITIGGSAETRKVLPLLGYQPACELSLMTRVVRPWLQFRSDPSRDPKQPFRMLRNLCWNLPRLPRIPRGWSATPVGRFEPAMQDLLDAALPADSIASRRAAEGLNYLLQCPVAGFSAFLVSQDDRLRGYFVVSRVGHQARIAELRLEGSDPASWRTAAALAARAVAHDPAVAEIVAGATSQAALRAFAGAGFRVRRRPPVYVLDPARRLNGAPLDLTMLDGDLCFFADPARPYLN